MSYCRWSTDDFQCDLYCYEDCNGGYTTHVAGRRRVYDEPLPPPLLLPWHEDVHAYAKRAEKVEATAYHYEEINLPHAGETFSDDTLEEFRARLLDLREIGYRFPDCVLDMVEEEVGDADSR